MSKKPDWQEELTKPEPDAGEDKPDDFGTTPVPGEEEGTYQEEKKPKRKYKKAKHK